MGASPAHSVVMSINSVMMSISIDIVFAHSTRAVDRRGEIVIQSPPARLSVRTWRSGSFSDDEPSIVAPRAGGALEHLDGTRVAGIIDNAVLDGDGVEYGEQVR